MIDRRFLLGAGLAGFALATSCSLAVETEGKQCNDDDDCKELSPDFALECIANLCELKEDEVCNTSAACVSAGGNAKICDTADKACVEVPVCEGDGDCDKYEGIEDYICTEEVCVEPECLKATDCDGEGFECRENRCVDPIWGCIGEPDDRKAGDDPPSFELQVLFAPAIKDTPVQNLQVSVCRTTDTACVTPLWTYSGTDTDDIQYDLTTGWLKLSSVQNGLRYNLRFTGERPVTGEKLLNGEYVMQRPVVGQTKEPRPVIMFVPATRDLFGLQTDEQLDGEGSGLLFARLFDCQGNQLPGAVIAPDKAKNCTKQDDNPDDNIEPPACSTRVFYFDTNNVPQKDATETDSAGRAGIINMLPDVTNKISCSRATTPNTPYTVFEIIPRANWITYSNVYPRKF